MKRLRRRLFNSLATVLLWQTMLLSVLPMLMIAVIALYASRAVVGGRFGEEGRYVVAAASNAVQQKASDTTNIANLLAVFPSTRSFVTAHDADGLTAFLMPMKSRFGVDELDVADANGRIIAAAEAGSARKSLPEPLVRRAAAGSEPSWALIDEPQGIVLHAISPIQNDQDETIAWTDVGVLLGPSFLRSIQLGSHAELALIWNNQVKASTFPLGAVGLPSYQEVDAHSGCVLARMLTIGGKRYLSTFTGLGANTDSSVTLAAFAPLAPIAMTRVLWALISVLGIVLGAGVGSSDLADGTRNSRAVPSTRRGGPSDSGWRPERAR